MRIPRLLALSVVLPAVALATSIVPTTLAERARLADRVVFAQVLEQQTVIEHGDPRRMKTITRLVVGQSFKGEGPEHLQLVQLGGKSGLWELKIPGDAQLEVGGSGLFFLRCGQPGRCYLVNFGHGHLKMVEGLVLHQDLATGAVSRRPLAAVVKELGL